MVPLSWLSSVAVGRREIQNGGHDCLALFLAEPLGSTRFCQNSSNKGHFAYVVMSTDEHKVSLKAT